MTYKCMSIINIYLMMFLLMYIPLWSQHEQEYSNFLIIYMVFSCSFLVYTPSNYQYSISKSIFVNFEPHTNENILLYKKIKLLSEAFFFPSQGFPGGTRGKEPSCQCRRHKKCRFDSWVGKIPWSREWQPTPVLPGESPWGLKELDTTKAS